MPLVQQVDVTDPHGYVRRVVFGSTGYMASDTHAVGQPEQQIAEYAEGRREKSDWGRRAKFAIKA